MIVGVELVFRVLVFWRKGEEFYVDKKEEKEIESKIKIIYFHRILILHLHCFY